MGFTFGGKDYYVSNLSSLYIDPTKYSPATLKAAITGKIIKSQLSASEAKDNDGDGTFTLSAKTLPLTISVKIYNDSDAEISSNTTKFRELLCSSTASKPYTAKIKIAGDLRLTTEYGDPRNKDYTSSTPETKMQPSKEYEVPISAICNLMPASMKVYDTGDLSIPGGYNTLIFDTSKGFKVDSGFPTTGFDKAVFSLIGAGNNQKDYKCEWESGGNWVTTSADAASTGLGVGCRMTYNSPTGKPSSPITIKMSYKGTKIDSFTIPVPTKWAIGMGMLDYGDQGSLTTSTDFPALNACRTVGPKADNKTTTKEEATGTTDANKAFRQKYLYRRNEITNSPNANTAEGSSPATGGTGYFSRDADGTFMGEWGYVYRYQSWVASGNYWVAEAWSTDRQFYVNTNGNVYRYPQGTNYAAICRGE